MKTYLTLLWGVSVLFSMVSMGASILETTSINSTAEPNQTTKQLISAHVAHNETETQPDGTWHPTHKPAEVVVAATAVSTASPTVETEEVIITHRSSNDNTTALVAMNTVAATASSSGPRLLHTSAAATTAAGEGQPSHSTTISETAKPTEDQLHRQSPTASTDMTAPAKTSAAVSSSPQPTSTTNPEVTSELSSPTSSASNSTQAAVFIQNLSSPSASATTTMTATPTSEAAPAFDPTSMPFTISETPITDTEVSSTSQPVSGTRTHISTSQFPDLAGPSSTAETPTTSFSTDSAATTTTAAVSTSPVGILIPRVPKRGPIPTTKSTPATTTAHREVSKSPQGTEVQPCSTRGIVKHCLIVIASLAGLATIFMVSTIVLCARLSARKYRVKKPQQATEMMCISALLPERNYAYTRQRNPVTNGVLVIHAGGDSDEDERDNLTLSSFLPENDRSV